MSLDLLKTLREKTGVGMLDCRKALVEANNDLDKAIEILRKKGIAIAAKRSDNATNCGSVNGYLSADYRQGSIVQMSCETDFSANTDAMKTFASNVAQSVATSAERVTESTVMDLALPASPLFVKDGLNELISKIAENIKVQRFAQVHASANGLVNMYIHADHSIGVIAHVEAENALTGDARQKVLTAIKDICMHVAVMNPVALDAGSLDPVLVAREKDVIFEQLKTSGKPANIVEKIAEGKLAKYFEDVCLVNQKFIKNDKMSIQEYLASVAKEVGCSLSLVSFTRLAIGR